MLNHWFMHLFCTNVFRSFMMCACGEFRLVKYLQPLWKENSNVKMSRLALAQVGVGCSNIMLQTPPLTRSKQHMCSFWCKWQNWTSPLLLQVPLIATLMHSNRAHDDPDLVSDGSGFSFRCMLCCILLQLVLMLNLTFALWAGDVFAHVSRFHCCARRSHWSPQHQ